MKIDEPTIFSVVYWSGQINDVRLRLDTFKADTTIAPVIFHSALAPKKQWNKIFCCTQDGNFCVSYFIVEEDTDPDKFKLFVVVGIRICLRTNKRSCR